MLVASWPPCRQQSYTEKDANGMPLMPQLHRTDQHWSSAFSRHRRVWSVGDESLPLEWDVMSEAVIDILFLGVGAVTLALLAYEYWRQR